MSLLDVQYLTDGKGQRTAVVIPIEVWEELQAGFVPSSEDKRIVAGLRDSVKEMKAVEAGTMPARDIESLLREL